ncbi:type I-E CRISPR-associated protein Cse1/CasA [Streptomyces antimicrobicus]|uniref:Type I-E CRISPR-associated protein Cse1/CasA n=1 Tax=Streptomyces antimicrobicus TaxID=2883108 RepID=A0ABS8BA67_9ACTN|nr:type I-E CRISPR-associated protein Cse1/CasA [Streptomyces antimicrobicus]MCB5181511.1 type I-E CRISPR-associated protein Cse1/CasA [Streptomyces antimicrobicus]
MSYPLTSRPWIPVHDLDARDFREVGLTEALARAHRLSLTAGPQDEPVLLRVLAAAYDAAAGPADYDEWTTAWQADTLDTARITDYLHQWAPRLDLLDTDAPAFQSGALTTYARDARVLHPSYLGGRTGLFDPGLGVPEGEYPAWEPAAAARALLVLIAYDGAGIKRAAPGDPAQQHGKVYGAHVGHVAQLAHVHVRGQTLKDTLLLNLPPQPRRPGDAPVWERPTPDAAMTVRKPAGRLDALTWPGRRIRLHADDHGRVDAVAWHDGDRMTDVWQQLALLDPMSMWQAAQAGRWIPHVPTDRQGLIVPWRVAEAVLDPAGDEAGRAAHCLVASHLGHLLDLGLLAQYGPLAVEASCVQHTNQHRTAIAAVPTATVALATGEQLTEREDRADLAAAARTASTVLHRLRQTLRHRIAAPAGLEHRLDLRPLYDRWPQAAQLLATDPGTGRAQWRQMLQDQAAELINSLPLNINDKARTHAEMSQILATTRFTSNLPAQGRRSTRRTGRPTSRTLTAFGQTKTIAQWAADPRCAVSYPTLRARAAALTDGGSTEDIITTPPTRGPRPTVPSPAPAPAAETTSTDPVPSQRRCINCGQPLPHTSAHTRCDDCRAARVGQDWLYRKEIAEAIFPPAKREELLRRLADGQPLADACTALDLTPHRVHGYSAYSDTWRAELDQALTAGRDPQLNHGTESAYRHGGCRCPDCREAHDRIRGPRPHGDS